MRYLATILLLSLLGCSSDHESIKDDFKKFITLSDRGDSSEIGKYIPPTLKKSELEHVIKERIATKYKTYDSIHFIEKMEILNKKDVKYCRFKTQSFFQLDYGTWPVDPVLIKLKQRYGMDNVTPSGAYRASIRTTEIHYAIKHDSSENWHFLDTDFSDQMENLIPKKLMEGK